MKPPNSKRPGGPARPYRSRQDGPRDDRAAAGRGTSVRDKVAGGSDARGADRRDGFGAGRSAGAAGKPARSGFRPDQRKADQRTTEARPPAAVPEHRAETARTVLRSPQSPDTRRGELRSADGRAPAAPKGTLWIYGLHAVASALANPNRRLRRLLLTEEAEATLAARLPLPWPLAPERGERGRMDQMLGRDVVHQGIALLADPLAPPLLAQVMERPGPLLVLDQVTDPRNIGAILRSAAAFGAAGVIAQDRNAPEETGAMAKAASGALEVVPLIRAVNLARTLVALKAAGCWVVGLDAAGGRLDGIALASRRVALVLGAEDSGLRRLTRETCDELAGLAMPGGIESLNVSAAASVALYELTRRPA